MLMLPKRERESMLTCICFCANFHHSDWKKFHTGLMPETLHFAIKFVDSTLLFFIVCWQYLMISSNLFKVNCASCFGCYQVLGYHVDIIIYNVFSNPSAALSNSSVTNTCGCMYKGTNSLAVSSVFVEAIPAGSTSTKTLPAVKRLNKNWSMFPE